MKRQFGIYLSVMMVVAGMSYAQEAADSGVYPTIPKALGEPHPEGNLFMRINHMNLLKHDRDETVRRGDRDIDYSLKECVACHVVAGPDALPITYENENYFCRACHDFAAVKIDCFQCHNSKPDPVIQTRLLGHIPDPAELTRYLERVSE